MDTSNGPVRGIKGFDSALSCRGFKFEIGKSYEIEGDIKACKRGFHACPDSYNPLSVFQYYKPIKGNRFAEVVQEGEKSFCDNKAASSKITIVAELSVSDLIDRGLKWTFDKSNGSTSATSGDYSTSATSGCQSTSASSGYYSTSASSGYRSISTSSGYQSTSASSGYYSTSASSGYYSTSATSGYCSASASSGNYSTSATSGCQSTSASSGYYSTSASSGYRSISTSSGNGSTSASSGDYSTSTSSGDYSTSASSGNYSTSATSGKHSVAVSSGIGGMVSGSDGNVLFAIERNEKREIVSYASGMVGKDGIKANTLYVCVGGKLEEKKCSDE